ncbi:hypothetical protein PMAC_003189 [Pneumocystis sp. 'macacae']|nr:hypothetical protein PMAC_003189 [Pneumocystis sp. 'macacae']
MCILLKDINAQGKFYNRYRLLFITLHQELSGIYDYSNDFYREMTTMCNKRSETINCRKTLEKIPSDTQNLIPKIARIVKRQTSKTGKQENNLDESYILAFILKKNYSDKSKCKESLQKYCKDLKEAYLELNTLDPKLEGICNDSEEKNCEGLKSKLEEKCKTLKTTLRNILNNSITHDKCSTYQYQCLLLEVVCPNEITVSCNNLRIACYQKERDNLAKEILLRAFKENLENTEKSQEKLKEHCPSLSGESDELMKMCLNQKETSEKLVEAAKNNCKKLEDIDEKVLGSIDNTACYSVLEKCYFYQPSCDEKVKKKCDEIREKCRNQKIAYTPPNYPFNPVTQEITIQLEIGLKGLYEKAKSNGILIGKPMKKDIFDFFLLLIQDSNITGTNEKKCQNELEKKCDFLKNLRKDLKNPCENSNNRESICATVVSLSERCKDLKKTLYKKDFSSNDNTTSSNIYSWRRLRTSITEEECVELLSKCFYLRSHCPKNLNIACKNLKAACYKKGRNARVNKLLGEGMHNISFNSKQSNNLKKCQEILVKKCKALLDKSEELFVLCINPKNTCITLLNDMKLRRMYLFQVLNQIRDMPEEHECFEFQKLCKRHEGYSDLLNKPCTTLKRRCYYLSNVKQLKHHLLKKNESFFSNKTHCIEDLGNECRKLFKRRENLFNYSCVWKEETCNLIYSELVNNCNTLTKNMENLKILQEAKDINKKEDICTIWIPYCEQLSPLCNQLVEKTNWENGKLCKELKNECNSFFQTKLLEDAIAQELEGNLSTKDDCLLMLKKYCLHWENTSNTTFANMCKSITDNNHEKIKEELCEKLVNRVTKQCSRLLKEIIKAVPGLQKEQKEYETIKKEIEDEMEKIGVIFSETETRNNCSKQGNTSGINKMINISMGFRLIKRENIKADVTEKELITFEKASRVYGLYLILKKKCYLLLKDCVFKKECNYEDECEKIENICTTLEPFQLAPCLTEMKIEKTITTETETITEKTTTTKRIEETENREKTIIEEEVCTSIRTIDVWVTHISTYITTSVKTSMHTTIKTSIITSTITSLSTGKSRSTKSITEESDTRVVESNKAIEIARWSFIKGFLIAIIISIII